MNAKNFTPSNITFYTNVSTECSLSHNTKLLIEGYKMPGSITCFKSIKNNYVLAYGNKNNYGIELYNIEKNRLEDNGIIKKAHSSYINNIRHYKEEKKNIDLLLTSSQDNSIKLWNYASRENLMAIEKASQIYNFLWDSYLTACLLFEDEKKYFISCDAYGNPNLKCWDSDGNKIKNIKINNFVMFLDNYIDKDNNNIIITCGIEGIILINFSNFTKFRQYHEENDKISHRWAEIHEIDKIKKLIETDEAGYVRIWNFDSCNLLMKITNNCYDNSSNLCLFGACLFDGQYLIIGGQNKKLNAFDLLTGTKVAEIDGHFNDKIITVLSINVESKGLCIFANDGNYHLNMLDIKK